MTRSPLLLAAVLLLASACGSDRTAEQEPPPVEAEQNQPAAPVDPVERRVEPMRQRALEADSLVRARERAVEELSRGQNR
jgi:hypothetical protein